MAPPKFADIGKKAKDLFKKQYDYSNEIKFVSKAKCGKFEGTLAPSLKANFNHNLLGDVEITANAKGAKGSVKRFDVLAKGLNITTSGSKDDVAVEGVFAIENVHAVAKATYGLAGGATQVDCSATLSYDAVALGASFNANSSEVDVGAQYADKGLVAAVVSSKNMKNVTASYHHALCGGWTAGASATVCVASGARSVALGGEYKIHDTTTLKFKASDSGAVEAALTHILKDPKSKINFAWKADGGKHAAGFGVTFGDY